MDLAECGKTMKCTFFEDNNRALDLAKILKIRPGTKDIGIKYYRFYTYIKRGNILLEKINAAKKMLIF